MLVVQLRKKIALERARTMQRNFVSYYLKKRGEKDAAMVAFYTEGLEDWRFSYVRMDYKTLFFCEIVIYGKIAARSFVYIVSSIIMMV